LQPIADSASAMSLAMTLDETVFDNVSRDRRVDALTEFLQQSPGGPSIISLR